MHVKLFTHVDDIPLDLISWNSLVEKNTTNTVFQKYEWFHSWWKHHHHDKKLIFLALYNSDNNIVAFAPLMLLTDGFRKKILRFVGDSNSDYCDFIITNNKASTIKLFLEFLYLIDIHWDYMMLLNIPEYSTTKSDLEAICTERKYTINIKTPVPTPSLKLEHNHNKVLKSINRYSINRHQNKLEKMGKLTLINLFKHNEIEHYLDDFFEQHIKRNKEKNIASPFTKTNNHDYYHDLINNLCQTNSVVFSVLKLDDKAIAYHLGFQYNNIILWYKPTFNLEYKKYSPGTILLKHLIMHAMDTSISEVDFSIGDENYKDRFCNQTLHNDNIVIYRNRFMGNIHTICNTFIKTFKYFRIKLKNINN